MKADLVIMDWGIGGLSVYNEVRKVLPKVSILYFSDSGQTPYGKMSATELKERLRFLINHFHQQGVRHFIIACNAASTALPSLEKEFAKQNLHVTGVIQRGIDLIRQSDFKTVGVIGGRRTIVSRSYTKAFRSDGKRRNRQRVQGRIAQPLSALIERGELDTPEMHKALAEILKPFRSHEALVLACTHYPAVSPLIQRFLPGCELLDPAAETAKFVKASWPELSKVRNPSDQTLFVTSGDGPQMKRAAKLAFDVVIPKVSRFR